MNKKQLDTTALVNELEQSAFFTSSHSHSPARVAAKNILPQEVMPPLPQAEHARETRDTSPERSTRTVEPNGRTVEEELPSSLLQEITQGVKTDRRPTERYSFEIYSDQIPQIEELQYLYKKRTGQKLPASRILREALEAYLRNAFEALKRKK